MLWIPKYRPEHKRQNITFEICASFTLWFSFISFFLFFPLLISFFISVAWSENHCLCTNPVLVLKLIQLFLYETDIIYVCLDENRRVCVSVWAFYGFLTTTYSRKRSDKWTEYYKCLNGNTFQRFNILWLPLKKVKVKKSHTHTFVSSFFTILQWNNAHMHIPDQHKHLHIVLLISF